MNDLDTRHAIGHMNYPGDVRNGIEAQIRSGWPMGPNYLGEVMWPVDAVYDATARRTRVGFSLVPPPAVANEIRLVKAKQIQQAHRLLRSQR